MANYLASSEFTFVHPSSGLLSGCPAVSTGYNLDFHVQQNVFSPINCTLPTTIQFPTPPVMSLPLSGNGLGSCLVEATMASAPYSLSCFPWQPGYMAPAVNHHPSLPTWPEATVSIQSVVNNQVPINSSTPFDVQSSWSEKFISDVRPQIRCKRKAVDIPDDCLLPTKIHVNEERMSACMNDLRLDNNNVGAQPDFENESWYSQDDKADASLGEVSDVENLDLVSAEVASKLGLNKNSRIEICHELELGLKPQDILPKVILDEMTKSSMQVVLWKPPEIFGSFIYSERAAEVNMPKDDENSNVDEDEMSNNQSDVTDNKLPTHSLSQHLSPSVRWSVELDATDDLDLLDDCEQMDL